MRSSADMFCVSMSRRAAVELLFLRDRDGGKQYLASHSANHCFLQVPNQLDQPQLDNECS
jgi:hypothetical protein